MVTPYQNSLNKKRKKWRRQPCASAFKGVYRAKHGKWQAAVAFDGRRYRLGTFSDEESAARAYDTMVEKLHGEFAVLNFPS